MNAFFSLHGAMCRTWGFQLLQVAKVLTVFETSPMSLDWLGKFRGNHDDSPLNQSSEMVLTEASHVFNRLDMNDRRWKQHENAGTFRGGEVVTHLQRIKALMKCLGCNEELLENNYSSWDTTNHKW